MKEVHGSAQISKPNQTSPASLKPSSNSMKTRSIPGKQGSTPKGRAPYAKPKCTSASKLAWNQNQLTDKEAIPKRRGCRKTKNLPSAPVGDTVLQPPHFNPNLYLILCCCSCGTGVVYLSGSKCLSVWQPAEYIKQALQTLYGPGSE